MRRKMIAGNWKMNNTNKEATTLVSDLLKNVSGINDRDIIVSPTFTCLSDVHNIVKGSNIKLAAQNMYFADSGAFTGQISADMLLAVGVEYVILGHSECRTIFGENDELINKKVKQSIVKGFKPMLCVGETSEEREKGITGKIVNGQIEKGYAGISEEDAKKIVIAYEPVWAIGTGKTATPNDADAVHKIIRDTLKKLYNEKLSEATIILYGGSVNETNANELFNMPNIDGGLVGGASLKADKFTKIINYHAK